MSNPRDKCMFFISNRLHKGYSYKEPSLVNLKDILTIFNDFPFKEPQFSCRLMRTDKSKPLENSSAKFDVIVTDSEN